MNLANFGYYLTPVLRVWLFLFFLLLCTLPFVLINESGLLPSVADKLVGNVIGQAALVVVSISALMMIFKVQPSVDFYLVFVRKAQAIKGFLVGAGFGLIIMVVCAALIYFSGNVSFTFGKVSGYQVALYLCYFLLIAVFEEFLFRTYPLYAMAERYPLWFAAVVNGLLFSYAHFNNPGITYLAAFNIFLAGLLFAVYTLQTNNIAWAVGIHFGWNFTQSVLLGYNVSGNNTIKGFFKVVPKGADYLSGGSFGIEGSVFCSVALMICLVWLILKKGWGSVSYYEDSKSVPDLGR